MKITKVETMIVDIPFVDGGKGEGIGPTTWNKLEMMLVRLEDDRGNVGWGEGFGYFVTDASKAVVDRMIAPLLTGAVIDDIPAWNRETQRRLHLFGRYGITLYAISGVDIALWDLKAKREQVPLFRLLSPTPEQRPLSFYASLVRYADDSIAPRVCERALADGFRDIKLHETTLPDIEACRRAVGPDVPLAIDVNCRWSHDFAVEALPSLLELGASWLEEPTFPPEEYGELASLRGRGLPIAAGENWCTAVQFRAALAASAVDHAQPSVTKVGGISEFLEVNEACIEGGVDLLPHSPYFGPGMHASMHLAAALPNIRQLEWLYVEPEAWLAPFGRLDVDGTIGLPDADGLGFEPDRGVLERYRRA